jgi:hypothetical protein
MVWVGLVASVGVLTLLSIAGAAGGDPVTIAASGEARLGSTATDGQVAWAGDDLLTSHGCVSVELRDTEGHRGQRLGPPSGSRCRVGMTFVNVSGGSIGTVVVSGPSALVGVTAVSNPGIAVELFGVQHGRQRPLAGYFASSGWSNRYLRFAGAGSEDVRSVVWGWWEEAARIHEDNSGGCLQSCRFRVAGGGIARWSGNDVTLISHAAPPALLASGQGLIAIDTFSRTGWLRSEPSADRIEVLRARDGSLVARFQHPSRDISSLAVSGSWLIAISRPRASRQTATRAYLEVRHLPDGRVRRMALPRAVFPTGMPADGRSELSLRGNLVVLHEEDAAWSLRLPRGKLHRIGGGASVRDAIALDHGQIAWSTCRPAHDACTIHIAAAR